MKTAISMFSFSENVNLKKFFPLIKQAGYDGVEVVLSENGYINYNTSEKEFLEIKKVAQDNNLEVHSVGALDLWNYNLVSNEEKVREKSKDIIKKQIEVAEIFGADGILAVPGYVGCDFAKEPERVRYDIAYDRCVEAFIELSDFAESSNVNIGIENVWNKFLLSPIELKRLIQEVNSQNVGAYFDVGNIIYIGYPEDWIEILDKDIKKIHLSDYRASQTGLGAFVDLFAGDVDFLKVSESLKKIAYDNYITLEMLPNYKQFPEVAMFSNKYAVDKIKEMMK